MIVSIMEKNVLLHLDFEISGTKLIEGKKKDLIKIINSSFEMSDTLTKKIKAKKANMGFLDKIKDMF